MEAPFALAEQPRFYYVDSSQYRQPTYAGYPSEMQPYYAYPPPQQQCVPEPQLIYHMNNVQQVAYKPAFVVDHDTPPALHLERRFVTPEVYAYSPNSSSPPPLSTPGSTIGSPLSTSDPIRTPASEGFFCFDQKVEGVKEGCENEVHSEILAKDWSGSATPPMNPGMIFFSPF